MATNLKERTARPLGKPVSMRVPPQALALIDHAAALAHMDRTTFMVAAAAERANETIMDQTTFVLPSDDFDALLDTLAAKRPVNKKLRQIMRHKSPWQI